MKIKTAGLIGNALDWAVAKCEGFIDDYNTWLYMASVEEVSEGRYHPSTDWAQAGLIIDREKLCIGYKHQCDPDYVELLNPATACWARTTAGGYLSVGPTPLTAAMRCYVASKLGDEVEVPDELV